MNSDADADLVSISDLLEPRHPALVAGLRSTLIKHAIPLKVIQGTNDLWCRDYMPLLRGDGSFVQFHYSPDYLRGYEHLITRPSDIAPIPEIERCHQSEVVLDGGNVVRWGARCIVTDKVFRANRADTRAKRLKLHDEIRELLGVAETVVIPTEPGDVIGHADGVVRFLDDRLVVVNDYSDVDRRYGRRLISILRQAGLEIVELPYVPDDESSDDEIPSAIGCYVNFLMVRGLIVVPTYGFEEDDLAYQVLQNNTNGMAVVPLKCSDLSQEGGVLNCATWTVIAEPNSRMIVS
jgi:agmatine deiminase